MTANTWLTGLSKTITVFLSPTSIRFESEGRSKTVTPLILLRVENGKRVIAAIGDTPAQVGMNNTKVDLFDGASDADKYDCLVEVLRHGIVSVSKSRWMIRPSIVCYGASSLHRLLSGYQVGILKRAFEEAGALQVGFK